MVNFRFHIVSLIAVFLALGLGILVGSTVVDQVIVDRLDREIKSVRHDSADANAENGKLKQQVSQNDDFLKKSAPFVVEQRLQDVPIAVVAERGISSDAVKQTVTLLREAGANVPGVVWLNDDWRLDSAKNVATLQSALKVNGNNAATRNTALRMLARRLGTPPTNGKASNDVLNVLENKGFISYGEGGKAAFQQFPNRDARVLVLTGTDSHLGGSDTLTDLVSGLTNNDVPTVAAEAYDENQPAPVVERGKVLAPVRGDSTLSKVVSTVDNADLTQGQIAATIALEQIAGGTVGHYGTGQGAEAPLPTLPS
jgi:hypothetical protein